MRQNEKTNPMTLTLVLMRVGNHGRKRLKTQPFSCFFAPNNDILQNDTIQCFLNFKYYKNIVDRLHLKEQKRSEVALIIKPINIRLSGR